MALLQEREQAFISSAFSVYNTEVRKSIHKQTEQIEQLEAAHEQLQQTMNSLEQLPAKLRHQVMVPMGKHAFFTGHLNRTNEIMVHLGDQYYVEVTAGHAKGILQRKQAAVAEGISKGHQQLKALQARLDVSADSLISAVDEPEAHEIRSSLAESDALLASARKGSRAAAASKQQQQQAVVQQQQQRVKSSSGYAYTRPEGPSTAPCTEQQDADEAALQARLHQLILLEEQQELHEHLQESQQQPAGLDTIQEGDEQGDAEQAAAAAATATAAESTSSDDQRSAGSSAATRLTAVHHLQQLEAGSDSDDEGDAVVQPHQHHQQQQQVVQPDLQQTSMPLPQQQLQQAKQPLKSALKKGFLGPAAVPSRPTPGSSTTSSRERGSRGGRGSTGQAVAPQPPKPAAFTGTVVERPSVVEVPSILERPSTEVVVADVVPTVAGEGVQQPGVGVSSRAPPASAAAAAAGSKPMSKFRMRRLGLDSQGAEGSGV